MVEVYSTNVKDHRQADFLLHQLGKVFPAYEINFDLQDCDNILRVESGSGTIEVFQVIALLNDFGFTAQVLPDTPECSKDSVPLDASNNSLLANST
ncbi:MAG TPA: hypothetical protein VFD29_06000 [Gillisia sp.]|nr:hypothetical protein [Gillisia sp.]